MCDYLLELTFDSELGKLVAHENMLTDLQQVKHMFPCSNTDLFTFEDETETSDMGCPTWVKYRNPVPIVSINFKNRLFDFMLWHEYGHIVDFYNHCATEAGMNEFGTQVQNKCPTVEYRAQVIALIEALKQNQEHIIQGLLILTLDSMRLVKWTKSLDLTVSEQHYKASEMLTKNTFCKQLFKKYLNISL